MEERARALLAVSDARERLDRELRVALAVPETAAALIGSQPRTDAAAIAAALARAADANKHLRKIEYVAENNAAAFAARRTVVSASFRLAGGGLGLAGQTPVFRGAQPAGTLVATISADSLFDEAGFRRVAEDGRLELALRSKSERDAMAGPAEVFMGDPVVVDYDAPGGNRWQLGAIPAGGWNAAARVPAWIVAFAALASIAIGFVVYRQLRVAELTADRMRFIEDLFESVPAALAMRDLDGRFRYVNRTWERMFDARRETVIGRHLRERIPEKDAEALLAMDRAAIASGPGTHLQHQEMIFRGRHLSQARSILSDAQGKPVGVLIANIDTTDRYVLEQTLAAQARQLEQQNEALKENVRLREEVERIGRHDLKTPLNSILAVPRLLREGRTPTREELDLINVIERAGYRILNMVNLSLDLFKMEEGTYRFEPRPVDVMEVVGKVMIDLVSHAESKSVLIRTVVNGKASSVQAPVYAWGDELLCYSMLGNLMKNAIEASPEGGLVTVSVEGPRDVIMVRLHNSGAVPAAIRESLFEKYHSVGKSEGTGLGTYSARLMARTQGGDISMRTSDESGTTISIWLRAAPDSAMPVAPDSAEHAIQAKLALSLGALRVLVVDDDEFNRLIVRRYLPPPIVVEAAVNGRAAVEAAEAAPDVVLMDLDMPIMDGYEAVARIRQDEARSGRRRASIIALSSHDDDETRARCLAQGFDFYLTKPVTRELLHETMARLSGRKAATPAAADDDLKALLPGFIASRRELAAQMHASLAAGDRDEVRRAAHKLAGSFALYGFDWAAEHCRSLERDAHSGEAPGLGAMIVALRDHLDRHGVVEETVDVQSPR